MQSNINIKVEYLFLQLKKTILILDVFIIKLHLFKYN